MFSKREKFKEKIRSRKKNTEMHVIAVYSLIFSFAWWCRLCYGWITLNFWYFRCRWSSKIIVQKMCMCTMKIFTVNKIDQTESELRHAGCLCWHGMGKVFCKYMIFDHLFNNLSWKNKYKLKTIFSKICTKTFTVTFS
jgi:hypothetical protein